MDFYNRIGFRVTEYTEDEETGRLWAAWTHRKGGVHDIAFTTELGAAVLNDPVTGIVWLSRRKAAYGQHIEAGQVILSGSSIAPPECPPGTAVTADFGPFGDVAIHFDRGDPAMPVPENRFKARLKAGEVQIGLWVALGDPSVAELCSHAGFDWLLLDGEHGPNGLRDILAQLRAVRGASHPIVRVRDGDRARIKQMLDIGAQTILIPMIESAEQARQAVRSMRYPPEGVRGVGASLGRASNYGTIPDYLTTANAQTCLLVQVESRAGLAAIEEIAAVDGVDGLFIGPADLAADMGHLGNARAPEVVAAIDDALARIRATGKAAGILTTDIALARDHAARGVEFLAVGSDAGTLTAALKALRGAF